MNDDQLENASGGTKPIVVLIGLHFLMPDKLSLGAAIVLAAVATATAPAATLMVVKQYKAKKA